ncbi:DUF4870 domain-containing protein [Bacillus taeanensis]|uniref:DUF4870 domain-containing protein n=1 Tax=Bacillus taeanensis TaxID=273032 RepID=A0A366Y472_9BACI|nr:DUF4870 domain-containing protein [Bacillus taeanensis]RBW71184.1 hypothetical protein DS031_00050 [Bacillus taeanensis]
MSTEKILASLCYFSVFFAPFLLPIIVWFVATDTFVKDHAKRSLLSHLVPFLAVVLLIIGIFSGAADFFGIAVITTFVLFGLLSLIITIWNIVQGIRILMR